MATAVKPKKKVKTTQPAQRQKEPSSPIPFPEIIERSKRPLNTPTTNHLSCSLPYLQAELQTDKVVDQPEINSGIDDAVQYPLFATSRADSVEQTKENLNDCFGESTQDTDLTATLTDEVDTQIKMDAKQMIDEPATTIPTTTTATTTTPNTTFSKITTTTTTTTTTPTTITIINDIRNDENLVTCSEDLLDLTTPLTPPTATKVQSIYPDVKSNEIEITHNRSPHAFTIESEVISKENWETIRNKLFLKPLTDMELLSFYPTPLLDSNVVYIDSFIRRTIPVESNNHPLYILLLKYQSAIQNLKMIIEEVDGLREQSLSTRNKVWEIEKLTQKQTGMCRDRTTVTKKHEYEIAKMDIQNLEKLETIQSDVRSILLKQIIFRTQECETHLLEISFYLNSLLNSCEEYRTLTSESPVRITDPSQMNFITEANNENLRDCLSVLLIFERRPKIDELFSQYVRQCIECVLSYLLRVASYADHLFILNHLLRCPPGISNWAAKFIQFQPLLELSNTTPGDELFLQPVLKSHISQNKIATMLDHFLTMLSTLLFPIRDREYYLKHIEIRQDSVNEEDKNYDPWIFVSEDAIEDDVDAVNKKYLDENDFVQLLAQFPFSSVFHTLLLGNQSRITNTQILTDHIKQVNSQTMLTVIAFASKLINIFGIGFATFKLARYREFVKRLGRMVRNVVSLISDFWSVYCQFNQDSMDNVIFEGEHQFPMFRLQLEIDNIIIRSTKWILSSHKLGAWQFLADMPFETVTLDALWKLFWLIHSNHLPITAEDLVSKGLGQISCLKDILKDKEYREQFIGNIMQIPASEATFLFTTFANMARARDFTSQQDYEFIETVILEIIEVSFINSVSRDTYARTGRDLLDTIAYSNPSVISIILAIAIETLFIIGDNCSFLFNTLPLSQWKPKPRDVQVLITWLTHSELGSNENILAQLILGRLNWGKQDNGELFLPASLHREVAISIVEACGRSIPKHPGHLGSSDHSPPKTIRETISSYLPAINDDQQKLLSWAWKVIILLTLHCDEIKISIRNESTSSKEAAELGWTNELFPLDLQHDESLVMLNHSVMTKGVLACYVALSISMIGHKADLFLQAGLYMLQILIDNKNFLAAIRIIQNISPKFFAEKSDNDSPEFLNIIIQLCHADQTVASFTEKWISGGSSKYSDLFGCMIQAQISDRWFIEKSEAVKALRFWVAIFISFPEWYRDKSILSLMNFVAKICFQKAELEKAILEELFLCVQSMPRHLKNRGGGSSLWSYVIGEAGPPSLLDVVNPQEAEWFSYYALRAEERFEQEIGLWRSLLKSLYEDPEQSVEVVLKKCTTDLKIQNYPLSHLVLYRWGKLCSAMTSSNPILPLCWQRFFYLFFQRPQTTNAISACRSYGYHLFSINMYSSELKALRKHLMNSYNHFKALADTNNENRYASIMAIFFQTLELWIDEPRLHEPDLYIAALPPQYDLKRLTQLIHSQLTLWTDLLNTELIKSQIDKNYSDWNSCFQVKKSTNRAAVKRKDAVSKILERLLNTDSLLNVPELVKLESSIEVILKSSLTDYKLLLNDTKIYLRYITDEVDKTFELMKDMEQIDKTLITLMPELYKNVSETVTISVKCKNKCTGACQLKFDFKQYQKNSSINQLIEANRDEWSVLFVQIKTKTNIPFAKACLRILSTIQELKELYSKNDAFMSSVLESGKYLFYELIFTVSHRTLELPSSNEFFNKCCQDLGVTFVEPIPGEATNLLTQIKENLSLAEILIPLFNPNICTLNECIKMYREVSENIAHFGIQISVAILGKFNMDQIVTSLDRGAGEINTFIEIILTSIQTNEAYQSQLVCSAYSLHFKILITHNFTDNFTNILHLLLRNSESKLLPKCIWEEFLGLLLSRTNQNFRLESEVILSNLNWISEHLLNLRLELKLTLFTIWKKYLQYFSTLISTLIDMIVAIKCEQCRLNNEGFSNEIELKEIWTLFCNTYRPWIFPVYDNEGTLSIPWHLSESEDAFIYVLKFANSIIHVQQMLPTRGMHFNFLNLFWKSYIEEFATSTNPESILHLYNKGFISLHWDQFLPTVYDLKLMLTLRESKEKFEFAAAIFVKTKWDTLFTSAGILPVKNEALGHFLNLATMLCSDEFIMRNTNYGVSLLTMTETYCKQIDWLGLQSANYQIACNWLRDFRSPVILLDSSGNAVANLWLIQSAANFPEYNADRDVCAKQIVYVKFMVELISKYSLLTESKENVANRAVTNLMKLIVGVAINGLSWQNSSVTPESQLEEFQTLHRNQIIKLLSELLNVLNICSPSSTILQACLNCIINATSPGSNKTSSNSLPSIIHSSMLFAASSSLASMGHMVQVIEIAIEAHFFDLSPPSQLDIIGKDGVQLVTREDGYGWKTICSLLRIPDLSEQEFVKECQTQTCCLTLYAKILLSLPLCTSLEDEMKQIRQLQNWISRMLIKPEIESKFILLIVQFLNLLIRQIRYGTPSSKVQQVLLTFDATLSRFGEDKSSEGLLGAIGLGKRSELSVKFRLISRILQCFLLAQSPIDSNQIVHLRVVPNGPGHPIDPQRPPKKEDSGILSPSKHTEQSISILEGLGTQKTYAPLMISVKQCIEMINDPRNTFMDSTLIFIKSVTLFYPDSRYLDIARVLT